MLTIFRTLNVRSLNASVLLSLNLCAVPAWAAPDTGSTEHALSVERSKTEPFWVEPRASSATQNLEATDSDSGLRLHHGSSIVLYGTVDIGYQHQSKPK